MVLGAHSRFNGDTAERCEHHERPDRVRESESTAMSMINRLRDRRNASRQSRAIDRALRKAPTQAMRDEIVVIAQRYTS